MEPGSVEHGYYGSVEKVEAHSVLRKKCRKNGNDLSGGAPITCFGSHTSFCNVFNYNNKNKNDIQKSKIPGPTRTSYPEIGTEDVKMVVDVTQQACYHRYER